MPRCLHALVLALAGTLLAAQTPAFTEPRWPQAFTLEQGSRAAFGFAVGAPGPIVVKVEARGLVSVVVLRPDGTVAREQQGTGAFRLEAAATKEDVAKGQGWVVSVRDPAAPAPRGARTRKTAIAVTLGVDHPAGDPARVQVRRPPAPPPSAAPRPEAILAAVKAARANALATERTQRLNSLQARLPPGTIQGLALKAPVALPATPAAPAAARAGDGRSSSGKSAPSTTTPPPSVATLDPATGSPGTQILITGTGFGATPGEVHFMVAPGKDLPGTIGFWSAGQILVQVPSIVGVGPYAGQAYVRTAGGTSRLVPFRFEPELDHAVLPITNDKQVQPPSFPSEGFAWHDGWPGIKGDDEYFLHTTLKNGWVLDEAWVTHPNDPNNRNPDIWPGARGDAYVSAGAWGTPTPRIKVHWWVEIDRVSFYLATLRYRPVVIIRGPKGLPWQ